MAGFTAIQNEVIARLGNRTDLAARSAIWINDAYFELLLNPTFEFFELDSLNAFNTIAGTTSYTFPNFSAVWHLLDLTDVTNNRKLIRTHWQTLDRITPTSGQPTRYARFSVGVILDPTPDAVYQIQMRYRVRPPELSATSSPAIGREWDEVITLLAVTKGWEALSDHERAALTRQLVREAISRHMDVPQLEDMDSTTTLAPQLLFQR